MQFLLAQTDTSWDWQRWLNDYAPNALAALAVLIVGWLVAFLISIAVKAILQRTDLDDRLAGAMREENKTPPDVSNQVSRVVFWVLMLFVLVAFLQVLGLTAVSGPLNNFLNQVFEYAPRLLAAALLVFAAWIVATVLRFVVRKTLQAVRLDERVQKQVEVPSPTTEVVAARTPSGRRRITTAEVTEPEAEESTATPGRPPVSMSRTLADATYWLVWLLFIPAILDALALTGLLAPVQNLVNQILGFLPNLLAAAAILVIGWFVARVIQRLVTNLLAAVGTDQLSERIGVGQIIGHHSVSQVIGLFVHILILLPVIIAALNALQIEAVTAPATAMLNDILTSLPNIFAAIVIVAFAYIIGRLVSGLVTELLSRIGFDRLPVHLGLMRKAPTEEKKRPSYIAGVVVLVAIVLVSAMQALHLLGFTQVEALLANFLVFAGHVLLGLVIFGFGLFAANFVANLIRDSDIDNARLLSTIARVAILVLAGAMALQEMGLASDIVNLAFGLTLGAIAVAAAIAFGIGGREAARDMVNEFVYSHNLAEGTNGFVSTDEEEVVEQAVEGAEAATRTKRRNRRRR